MKIKFPQKWQRRWHKNFGHPWGLLTVSTQHDYKLDMDIMRLDCLCGHFHVRGTTTWDIMNAPREAIHARRMW